MAWEGPNWGREVLFPANPDLADILGDTDFDFENFHVFDVLDPKIPGKWMLNSQESRRLDGKRHYVI